MTAPIVPVLSNPPVGMANWVRMVKTAIDLLQRQQAGVYGGGFGGVGGPGPAGPPGQPGSVGPGVPAGGTTGQVLTKNTGTDYDTAWADPTGGSGGGGGGGPRSTTTATTSSLAPNANDPATTISLAKTYRLLTVQTSLPARVRLYTTAAAQAADAGRGIGTDPLADAGVTFEYVTVDTNVHSLSLVVEGMNLESTPSGTISMTVTNLGSTTGTVLVTLLWEAVEL